MLPYRYLAPTGGTSLRPRPHDQLSTTLTLTQAPYTPAQHPTLQPLPSLPLPLTHPTRASTTRP